MPTTPNTPQIQRHPKLLEMIEEARFHMKWHGTGTWTDDQLLASYAIACITKGYHHIYGKIKGAGPTGVTACIYGTIATFDFDALTRAVLIAHRMGVRLEIGNGGPRALKIFAHARHTSDDASGEGLSFAHRHPSLDHLIQKATEWKLPTA